MSKKKKNGKRLRQLEARLDRFDAIMGALVEHEDRRQRQAGQQRRAAQSQQSPRSLLPILVDVYLVEVHQVYNTQTPTQQTNTGATTRDTAADDSLENRQQRRGAREEAAVG